MELIADATFNCDAYGFYGLSVWVPSTDWSLDRVLSGKLARAATVAVFTAGDLYDSGLTLLATGQHPHHDAVLASAEPAHSAADLVDRFVATPYRVVDNERYQDPGKEDIR